MLQTDKDLHRSIQGYGCFLLSAFYGAFKATKRMEEFNAKNMNRIFSQGVKLGYIADNEEEHCFIHNLWDLLAINGFNVKSMDHTRDFKRNGKTFDLIKYEIAGEKLGHWVCGDGLGHCVYNPDPECKASKSGSPSCRWLVWIGGVI